jgi:phosphoribosylanthranilate isomerase
LPVYHHTVIKALTMLQENLIQIAGVIDAAEAQMLQQCGIRYLGFPLRLPVPREDLTEEQRRRSSGA